MPDDILDDDALWWNIITGPSRLVKAIVSDLTEGRSVLFGGSGACPWKEKMRRCVELALSEKMFELIVDFIDCAQEDDPNLSVGRYLLTRLRRTDSRVAYGYRGDDEGIIQYLRDNGILKNRVLWLKRVENEEQLRRWLVFCLQYETNRDPSDGLIVIETFLKQLTAGSLPEHVAFHNYNIMVTPHDTLSFCSLLSARSNISGLWKQYIATLAATLFYGNIEQGALFIKNTDFRVQDPADRQSGALLRGVNAKRALELQRMVWKAQLQFVFPLIEETRIDLAGKYKPEIDAALLQAGMDAMWYGQQITDAYSAELGLLIRLSDSHYLVAFQNEDKQRIKFLHACRNKLAHMKCCSPEELDILFSGSLSV
ncbi:hypothetical protein AGMMS50276_27300 [Synergistales bacterium]|nr:hypothetical protein AGMMS50276_27300 [Synergistales bacterium]